MKRLLTYAALSILIASCQKGADTGTPQIDPTKSYSINVEASEQIVKTSVENNRLKLDHNEKIDIYVDPVEFSRLWAVALEENWEGTYLNGLDFTCMNEFGTQAFNWRAGNLNNVHSSQKTVTVVTVDGKRMKKISVNRTFHFYKDFPNQQAAIDKQNALLQTTNEAGKFRGYFTYNGVNSLPKQANGTLKYTR